MADNRFYSARFDLERNDILLTAAIYGEILRTRKLTLFLFVMQYLQNLPSMNFASSHESLKLKY